MSGVAASSPSERRCKAMALPPLRDEDARAIDTFLDASWAEAGLSRQTLSSYRRDLAGVARWRDGAGGGLAGADRAALFDYLAARARDGYQPRSNARLLSALRAFFAYALRRGNRGDERKSTRKKEEAGFHAGRSFITSFLVWGAARAAPSSFDRRD